MGFAIGIDRVQNCHDSLERLVKGQKRECEVRLNTDILGAPQSQFMRFDADKFLQFVCPWTRQANGIPNRTSHAFENQNVTKNVRHTPKQNMRKNLQLARKIVDIEFHTCHIVDL